MSQLYRSCLACVYVPMTACMHASITCTVLCFRGKQELDELQTRRELLAQIIKRKMAFFGHSCRNNKCNLVKTCILGMMPGKRRRGRPRMQYIDNIKKWTRASLEDNATLTEDRTAWRERSCAAGAANVRTDDAD